MPVSDLYQGILNPGGGIYTGPPNPYEGILNPGGGLYTGKLGGAPPAAAAPTPQQLSPDVYRGIYGPANLSSPPGDPFSFGDMLGEMRVTPRTAQAAPAPANPTGFQSGFVKADNERLLGGVYPAAPTGGIGLPPTTRRVPSVQMAQQPNIPPMPIARPERSILAAMFMPTPVAQRPTVRPPLEVSVNGAGTQPVPGYPTPAANRPRPVSGWPTPASQRPSSSYSDGGSSSSSSSSSSYSSPAPRYEHKGQEVYATPTNRYNTDTNTFETVITYQPRR